MKERSSFGHIKSKHAGQKNPIHRALSLSTALLAGPHHDTTHPGTQWGKLKTYNLSDWWRSVHGLGSSSVPAVIRTAPRTLVIRSNQGHGDTGPGPGPQPRLTRAGKLCGNEILI